MENTITQTTSVSRIQPLKPRQKRRRCRCRVSLAVALLSWTLCFMVLTSLAVGLPGIVLGQMSTVALSDSLRRSFTSKIVSSTQTFFDSLFGDLSVLMGVVNTHPELQEPYLPWCTNGSHLPPAALLMVPSMRKTAINAIMIRRMYENGAVAGRKNGSFVAWMQGTFICQDLSTYPAARMYALSSTDPAALVRPRLLAKLPMPKQTDYFIEGTFVAQIYPVAVGPKVILTSAIGETRWNRSLGPSADEIYAVLADLTGFARDLVADRQSGDNEDTRVVLVEDNWDVVASSEEGSAALVNGSVLQYKLPDMPYRLKRDGDLWTHFARRINATVGSLAAIDGTLSFQMADGNGRLWLVDVVLWKYNSISAVIVIVVARDAQSVMGKVWLLKNLLIGLTVAVIVLSMAVAGPVSFRITRPLRKISRLLKCIAKLDFESSDGLKTARSHSSLFSEVHQLQKTFLQVHTELSAFVKYVPTSVCANLVQGKLQPTLGVKHGEVTVLFLDVVDFSRMTETEKPEVLVQSLARTFDHLCQIIQSHQGTIDKFMGDAIMSFWNEPVPVPRHAERAAEATLECLETANKISELEAGQGPRILVKFGLSTGPCLIGNIGGKDRFNFTITGRFVNEAARLEPATRVFGVDILVSQSVHEATHDAFLQRRIRECLFKGFEKPRAVYELISSAKSAVQTNFAMAKSYGEALEFFEDGNIPQTLRALRDHLEMWPNDLPARVLMHEAESLTLPLPPDWTAVKTIGK
eukprot:m51a1_g14529 hypothetical protein (751) ;mRNA; r:927723-930053